MGSEATTSRRRILDYLNDGEELGVDGPSTPRAVATATARSLLPRFRWTRVARLGRKGCGSCAGVKVQQPQQPEKQEIAAEVLVIEQGDELNDMSADTGAWQSSFDYCTNQLWITVILVDSHFH
jgi:hypothetical protein